MTEGDEWSRAFKATPLKSTEGRPAACLKVTCGAMQGRAASSVLASLPGVRRIGARPGRGDVTRWRGRGPGGAGVQASCVRCRALGPG